MIHSNIEHTPSNSHDLMRLDVKNVPRELRKFYPELGGWICCFEPTRSYLAKPESCLAKPENEMRKLSSTTEAACAARVI